MSLYENFLYSNFPESIDTYEYMQDLTSDTYVLAQRYQTLINQNKFAEAYQILIDNPELNRSIFNAEKYNKIIDSIKSTQTLYSEDVRKYILELMSFKGEYSNLQKYIRYNVVNYDSNIYLCTSDCPLGTLPTDTNYWYPLSIKGDTGDKGDDGLGLHFSGEWSSSISYSKDAAVTYNNCLYASIYDGDNLSHTPSNNSDYWILVIDFNTLTSYDNSSSNLSSTTLQGAIDELNNALKDEINELDKLSEDVSNNRIDINANTTYIEYIHSRVDRVDNTKDKEKEVKYADSSGNADTVDGFHIVASTEDLTPNSSPLTTNTLYFVYQ